MKRIWSTKDLLTCTERFFHVQHDCIMKIFTDAWRDMQHSGVVFRCLSTSICRSQGKHLHRIWHLKNTAKKDVPPTSEYCSPFYVNFTMLLIHSWQTILCSVKLQFPLATWHPQLYLIRILHVYLKNHAGSVQDICKKYFPIRGC